MNPEANAPLAGAAGSALDVGLRPEIRSCVDCGVNEPETGTICDECRWDAMSTDDPTYSESPNAPASATGEEERP